MKWPNLSILEIEDGEEFQLKSTENIFNKIIAENFSNLKEDIPMMVQDANRTSNKLDQKKFLCNTTIKMQKIQNKERMLRTAKEKDQVKKKMSLYRLLQ